jgi:cobalt-zinc-cadmium efflux system outer membrane protein
VIAALILTAVTLLPQQFSALPLDTALQKAVANSPDVAQARERVTENAALVLEARGVAAPSLTAGYAASPQGGPNNNTIVQSLFTIGGQVTLGDYLSSSYAVRQATFTLAGAQYDFLEAQRAERIKVSAQYYTALKAYAAVQLRKEEVAGAQADLRAAELRFHAGDAPRLDVVRARVGVANAQSAFSAARVDLQNAQSALAIETGEPAQTFATLSAVRPPADPPADADRDIARALAQRSDLASAQQLEKAEEAAVRVAEGSGFPAVTVGAGYTTGMDSGVQVHGPSATVNVSLPVSHAAAARVAAERARLAQAQYKVESIRRQIQVAVGAAARTYAQTVQATQSAQQARTAAQQALRATQIGYRNGASSSLDLDVARRTYSAAALDELDAVYAQAQAAATLEEEMGP